MKKQMTWIDAIIKVLESTKNPMHYTKIWDVIRDKHYRECDADTNPEIIVNANIQQNKDKIVSFGDKGCYILKKHFDTSVKKYLEQNIPLQQNIIHAYGEHWNRAKFTQSKHHLYGKLASSKKGSTIDLSDERGVYVLYQGYEVVYIGQSMRQTIARRLKQHDDIKKWDSFSWYGIDEISEGKVIKEKVTNISSNALVDTLEAILISAAYRQRNERNRGKYIRNQEYQQI